jgi:iron-sulfur cluster assembly protein
MSETSTAPVTLTPEAVDYAKKKRVQLGQPDASLRVGVKGGGCAGLTYVSDFTEDPPRERDMVFDYDGLKVIIDPRSVPYIEGSTLTYENTLMYQGLKWQNPQQESACGCGATFSVKEGVVAKAKKQLKTA